MYCCRLVNSLDPSILRNDIAERGWLDSAPSMFTKKETRALDVVKEHCKIIKVEHDLLLRALT